MALIVEEYAQWRRATVLEPHAFPYFHLAVASHLVACIVENIVNYE